ncbi:MAG: threonine-phosphate decarboxylase CobD [Pseudomonadota bacterium]
MTQAPRDHGGNLDAAVAQYGGARSDWIDLSTGINPNSYPLPRLSDGLWTALPDAAAFDEICASARQFWNVPDGAAVLPVPGASAAIAQLPRALPGQSVMIPAPTYNEHQAAFAATGWTVQADAPDAQVAVHPNNPDGRMWTAAELTRPVVVIDESFCDVRPDASHIGRAARPGTVILKSFGKFWGLAGLRLGFAIGDPSLIEKLKIALGPWQVSGPALFIGTQALRDFVWADETRARLASDSDRLDAMMAETKAAPLGGTTLFRLYEVADAKAAQAHLAQHHIWSRVFPYAQNWLRLGLPNAEGFKRLAAAL